MHQAVSHDGSLFPQCVVALKDTTVYDGISDSEDNDRRVSTYRRFCSHGFRDVYKLSGVSERIRQEIERGLT